MTGLHSLLHTDRQTDRQGDRDRQTDRQTDSMYVYSPITPIVMGAYVGVYVTQDGNYGIYDACCGKV